MALFLKISTLPLPLKSFQLCRTLPTNSLVYSKRSFSVLSQRHYEGNILPTAPGLSNLRTLSTGSSVAQDYLSASTSVFGWMANLPPTVFVQGKQKIILKLEASMSEPGKVVRKPIKYEQLNEESINMQN